MISYQKSASISLSKNVDLKGELREWKKGRERSGERNGEREVERKRNGEREREKWRERKRERRNRINGSEKFRAFRALC